MWFDTFVTTNRRTKHSIFLNYQTQTTLACSPLQFDRKFHPTDATHWVILFSSSFFFVDFLSGLLAKTNLSARGHKCKVPTSAASVHFLPTLYWELALAVKCAKLALVWQSKFRHSHCHSGYLMRLIRFALCASRTVKTAAESNGLPCSHHGHVFALVLLGWTTDPNGNFLFLYFTPVVAVSICRKKVTLKSLNFFYFRIWQFIKWAWWLFSFSLAPEQFACMLRKC